MFSSEVSERSKQIIQSLRRAETYRTYLPKCGVVGYALFNLNVSIDGGLPRYVQQCAFDATFDYLCNFRLISCCGNTSLYTMLLSSHTGFGLYIFNHRFQQHLPKGHKILYSAFISTLFNFGSILFIAVIKNFLYQNNLSKATFSLLTSYSFLLTGVNLLNMIEQKC